MSSVPKDWGELENAARRLRPALNGRRVLLVGVAAERPALRTLVRLAGARVMAAPDVGVAITLVLGFPIDIIIAEPRLQTAAGESFESTVRRCGGISCRALFVDMPDRPTLGAVTSVPSLRLAYSRPAMSRPTPAEGRERRRMLPRRVG